MKNLLKICIIILYLMPVNNALVLLVKLGQGKKGCLGPHGEEMAVGEEVQDQFSCGVLVCSDTEGNGFLQFCQKTAPFAKCSNPNVVNIKRKFPDCCWECVKAVDCKKSAKKNKNG